MQQTFKRKTAKRYLCILCLFLLSLAASACGKKAEQPEPADWQDNFGKNQGVTQEGESTQGSTPAPSQGGQEETSESQAVKLPFPTLPLPREFVPGEEQVELVMWVDPSGGRVESYLDEYIVAELNYRLQQRGCTFYLTVEQETYTDREIASGKPFDWQERIDAVEHPDILFLFNESAQKFDDTGITAPMRAILGGYLLPVSAYPNEVAKERLLAAYPERFWEMSSFCGEIYGIYHLLEGLPGKYGLMMNLDLAEQAGITAPDTLELTELDALLAKAKEAGITGVTSYLLPPDGTADLQSNESGSFPAGSSLSPLYGAGIRQCPCGLYVKLAADGTYRVVNPLEEEGMLALWEASCRYNQNGWGSPGNASQDSETLILWEDLSARYWKDDLFYIYTDEKTVRMKCYAEYKNFFMMEGEWPSIVGVTTASEHPAEAAELLSLMYGDEEIVQLLRYGLEGIHYTFGEDGLEGVKYARYMDETKQGYFTGDKNPPMTRALTNQWMYLPMDAKTGKPDLREEIGENLQRTVKLPYLEGFPFTEGQKEQLKEIRKIFSSGIHTTQKDCMEQIEQMRKRLEEAGYNELMEEVNQKYGLK